MGTQHKLAWQFFAAGGTLMFIGGAVRVVHATMAHVDRPLPSPADALYYLGYVCFILGAFELLKKRSDAARDADAWLDALIVVGAVALALVIALTVNWLKDSFTSRSAPPPQSTAAPQVP